MTTPKQPTDSQARRRKEILDVATRLFAQRGFNGTSMDDIAKELGILKGSLYYWIDSKESLLAEVLAISPMLDEIAQSEQILAHDLPASERLRLMVHVHIDLWVLFPHNFQVFMEYSHLDVREGDVYYNQRSSLENLFKKVVRQGIDSGEFEIALADLSIVVNSMFGIMNWFPRWYAPEGPSTPSEIADVMTSFMLRGLGSDARGRAKKHSG
jgi:AcrR family transcriptional regulator